MSDIGLIRQVLVGGLLAVSLTGGASEAKESIDVSTLHKTLESREKVLDQREQDLNRREKLIVDKEALVQEQLGRYEEAIGQLRKQTRALEEQDNKRVEGFKKIYAEMEPKRAAKILNDVDLDLAGRILSSLKENHSAQILGRMSPAKARALTEKFFARRSHHIASKQAK